MHFRTADAKERYVSNRWFAWRPVLAFVKGKRVWVWLETVERSRSGRFARWEYSSE